MAVSSHNIAPHARLTEDQAAIPDTRSQDRMLPRRGSWSRHRRLVLAGLALAALAVGFTWLLLHFHGALLSVDRDRLTIATVERRTFIRDIAAEGQVVAAVSPTLYAPYGGTVTLQVHAGDVVEKGQLLATIDTPDLTAKLAQEEATLLSMQLEGKRARLEAGRKLAQMRSLYQQADIDRGTAQRELDRSRKAFELGAYSELQVLRAEDELKKAQFAYEQAKINLDAQPKQNGFEIDSSQAVLDRQQVLVSDLHRQVAGLQIRSPVTGNVGQVAVADRASVARDSPLLTVIDLSALELQINVPESLARDLAVGMPANLEGAGRSWQGTVGAISPQVVNGEVVARVRFRDQKPTGLRQSQRLSARIYIERRENALTVDRGPFLDQDGGRSVYVVRGNKAIRQPVRLGASSVEMVEILSGLKQGDQIVVSGGDAFHGAQEVILSH
jgi:HlyD family secretion protein